MESKQKPCVHCGGNDFYSSEVGAGGGISNDILPLGFLHGAHYQIIVCGSCGDTRWVVPERFLYLVKEKLSKVSA
jgi:predicted nucleic-acid-binding Zn-ribbon protein